MLQTSISIIIASKNPVKIAAVESAFTQVFPHQKFTFAGITVSSEVSDQPMSEAETITGARNRCHNAEKQSPAADYFVGLEGGLLQDEIGYQVFAWMVIKSGDKYGYGKTGSFYLPPKVAQLIDQGYELGAADDIIFHRHNSKQAGGSVGLLTNNLIDRTQYYTRALIFALIPFKTPELY